MGNKKTKIHWLQVLQGLAMLLVVLGHSPLTELDSPNGFGPINAMSKGIYDFHMALMFLVSGYLLFFTAIEREKNYASLMHSKFVRLGIPFLFFTVLATGLKIGFASLMKRQVASSVSGVLLDIFVFGENPLGEMWFIYVLIVYMAFYPVYVYLQKSVYLESAFCIVLFCLSYFAAQFKGLNYFYLPNIVQYFVYFYIGILICKYNTLNYLNSWWGYLGVILACFAAYKLGLNQSVRAICDCILVAMICYSLGSKIPKLFSSFRDYTFQIYLMGIFFQMLIVYIWKYLGENSDTYLMFWVVNIILGLYMPVIISIIVKKQPIVFLRKCVGM